jgi:class 3 adenylate cyclase
MERRFAALLIADVVGYVRLSQADEVGRRAWFQADLDEVFEPTITAHHGARGPDHRRTAQEVSFWQKWQRLRRHVRCRISRSNGSQTAHLGAVWHIVLTPVT